MSSVGAASPVPWGSPLPPSCWHTSSLSLYTLTSPFTSTPCPCVLFLGARHVSVGKTGRMAFTCILTLLQALRPWASPEP